MIYTYCHRFIIPDYVSLSRRCKESQPVEEYSFIFIILFLTSTTFFIFPLLEKVENFIHEFREIVHHLVKIVSSQKKKKKKEKERKEVKIVNPLTKYYNKT